MSTTNLGYPEIEYRPIYKVFLGLKEIPKPHTRTNADSPSFKMLQERENQGSSVHPGPHFRQAAHARLEGPKAPASRIPAAPTGVSPSPRDARAAPAPSPGVSLARRPGQALDVIQQVTGGPAFSRSRSLSGVLGAGPQILLGPDHSGKSPANRGAPGPPRNLFLCPQPLLEIRSAWAPTGRRPPAPHRPTIPSKNESGKQACAPPRPRRPATPGSAQVRSPLCASRSGPPRALPRAARPAGAKATRPPGTRVRSGTRTRCATPESWE